MRWIDRGTAPKRVAEYAREYTPGWVSYVRDGVGSRPDDRDWYRFRSRLGKRSCGMCWYCERRCESASETGGRAATLDHFKPRSLFPELVYDWSNWIFSCLRCNRDNKEDKWPDNGYVDPAAIEAQERPDRYFDYDALTHEIIPKNDLSGDERKRAVDTIGDLGLNKVDVLSSRQDWMQRFIENMRQFPEMERAAFAEYLESEPHEFLGAMQMVLAQLREGGEITDGG